MNLIGQKFNKLVVVDFAACDIYSRKKFKCICECGNEVIVRSDSLKSGNTKTCGCLRKENIIMIRKRLRK